MESSPEHEEKNNNHKAGNNVLYLFYAIFKEILDTEDEKCNDLCSHDEIYYSGVFEDVSLTYYHWRYLNQFYQGRLVVILSFLRVEKLAFTLAVQRQIIMGQEGIAG